MGSCAGMDNQAEPEGCSSTSECKVAGKSAVGCMELPGEEKEIAYTKKKKKWDGNTDKTVTPHKWKLEVLKILFSETNSGVSQFYAKLEHKQ